MRTTDAVHCDGGIVARPVATVCHGSGHGSTAGSRTRTRSQVRRKDGSSGGTNTPSGSRRTMSRPDANGSDRPDLSSRRRQDDFNPGLLDPLAWTVADEQPFGDGTESFDGEDPLLPMVGAGAAGPSTLMDRLDEVAIGGTSDYHSAAGWRAIRLHRLNRATSNLAHPS